MKRPYFEAVRIAMDEDTKEEFEYKTAFLWCNVARIEEPDHDTFKNQQPKSVVITSEGCIWILTPFEEVRAAWFDWLNDATQIQSVFRNN